MNVGATIFAQKFWSSNILKEECFADFGLGKEIAAFAPKLTWLYLLGVVNPNFKNQRLKFWFLVFGFGELVEKFWILWNT